MFLSKMKLGTKLTLAFSIILAFMIIVEVMGINRMGAISQNLQQIVTVDNKKVDLSYGIITKVQEFHIAMRNLTINEDAAFNQRQKAIIDKARAGIGEDVEQALKLAVTQEGKQALISLKEIIAAGKPVNDKVVSLGLENKNQEANKLILEQADPIAQKTFEMVNRFIKAAKDVTAQSVKNAENDYKLSWLIMIGVGVFAFLATGFIAFFLTRSITKPISRVTEGLAGGADQVSAASSQVSSSSQELAEGTSEQAAGIEEISSSLEEMSSMTRQNAQAANDANQIMQETSRVVSSASESMHQLTDSMAEIFHASEETQKIVKTIDEISFQTNLLALNAAVEAARAGEAGAGFAVVSDEVRNLAMRAADAAKNTANLIESTVKKIKDGSDMVTKTSHEFSEVVTHSAKVGELIGEIAAASREQAQGIEQVSKAISDADRIVQQNAANAEESASASEEMNAQAEQMKDHVQELIAVINGKRDGSAAVGRQRTVQAVRATGKAKVQVTVTDKGKAGKKALADREASRKLIPFEEDNTCDF